MDAQRAPLTLKQRLRLAAIPIVGATILGLAVDLIKDIKDGHKSAAQPDPEKALQEGRRIEVLQNSIGINFSPDPEQRSLEFYGQRRKLSDTGYLEVRSPITTENAEFDRFIEAALRSDGRFAQKADGTIAGREFVIALMAAESGFNPEAENNGYLGLMQLKIKQDGDTGGFLREDLLDPEFSINKGIEHFGNDLEFFANQKYIYTIWWALAGYNMGDQGFLEHGLLAWQQANNETREPTPKEMIDFLRKEGHEKTARHLEKIALLLDYINPPDVPDADIRSYTAIGDRIFPIKEKIKKQ